MNYVPHLALVAGVMLLACVSPGPDLMAVTSQALARRRAGLLAACGIATSHALWATLAIFGLGLVLAQLAWLYGAIRVAGALYLIHLGIRMLASLGKPAGSLDVSAASASTALGAYRRGLFVGLTNPKGAAFFGGLFVTVLPAHAPLWVHATTVAAVSIVSLGWFNAMAFVFSMQRVQYGYGRIRKIVDGTMGTILIALGAKLALDR
ncbi:LysE family transporter [Paraburkholderia humisilvae]|uniref:Threonine efflux protein n=1 Tax=Paraburkholderia humisilvae TaxID=627669 RepID=A0A6J5D1Y3_9BURK|nr:LysE family transporter [Paraburkholderia humisilvae]CAB3746706.1 Threonine efflux protein [Paraburkholderia humisilvae]